MSVWTKISLKGTAKYPFDYHKPGYLTLISGDKLEILQETDNWYYARNLNTFKTGICPASYVKLEKEGDFTLIELECYELLKNQQLNELLNCPCDLSTEQAAMPSEYATIVKTYEQIVDICVKPEKTKSDLDTLVRSLGSIRKYLGIQADPKRTSETQSIVTTTDLNSNTLLESKSDSTSISYESTYVANLTLGVLYNNTARIVPRLYQIDDNLNKQALLTAPADIYHAKQDTMQEHKVTFPNLDKTNYLLEIRVLSHRQFGAENEVKGPFANEYIAVGADFIIDHGKKINAPGLKKPKELDEFGFITYDMDLYKPQDNSVSFHNVVEFDTQKQNDKLMASEFIQKIVVSFEVKKVNTKAITPDGINSVHALKESSVITPKYKANHLFFHLEELKHKSIKRTRIVLHVLDFVEKKFIKNCFDRMEGFNDGSEFPSVVEKKHKDFILDEMASINLERLNPENCVVVIEVQRPSRSKGTVHESSYGFHFITDVTHKDAKIDTFDSKQIFLQKPGSISFKDEAGLSKLALETREKLKKIYELEPKKKEEELKKFYTETTLTYRVILLSTKYSNLNGISTFIDWDKMISGPNADYAYNQLEGFLKPDTTIEVPRYFFPQVFRVLALCIKDQKYSQNALSKYQELLIRLDRDLQRHQEIMKFYRNFLEQAGKNDEFSGIHVKLLEFINQSLPTKEEIEKIQEGDSDRDLKDKISKTCRALPYFLPLVTATLNLLKNNNNNPDPALLTTSLKDLAEKIQIIFKNKALIVQQNIVATVYQLICDLILDTFPINEAEQLVIPLVTSCCSVVTSKTHQIRMKTAGMSAFNIPELHHKLFTAFINTLQLYTDRQIHTIYALVPLLFSILTYTDDFENDMLALLSFTETLMYDYPYKLSSKDDNERDDFYLDSNNIEDHILKFTQNFKQIIDPESTETRLITSIPYKKSIKTMHTVNLYFILLLIYHAGSDLIQKAIAQRGDEKNQELFFYKLLSVIRVVLECETIIDQPEYLFICLPAALSVLSTVNNPKFSFLLANVSTIIKWINEFYKLFLKKSSKLNKTELIYNQRIYPVDLKDLATMLPSLLDNMPEDKRYIPSILVPFFHFYISSNDAETKKRISSGLITIVRADYANNKSLENSFNAIMDALNNSATDNTVKDNLLELVKLVTDAKEALNIEPFSSFFDRVNVITKYMYDINTIPSDPQHEIQKTTALLTIINSTMSDNDDESIKLFLHFSSILYELQKELKNTAEQAETLVLTANALKWNDTKQCAEGHDLPTQQRWERKRDCLRKAILLFVKTYFYENSLNCINQLKDFYLKTYDYHGLSKICLTEKMVYDKINSGQRPPLNYFYGIKFNNKFSDPFWNNKMYIFRTDFTKTANLVITDFKRFFPGVEVSSKEPSEEESRPYIHVFNVFPNVHDEKLDYMEDTDDYKRRHQCDIDSFYSKIPITKKRSDRSLGETAESFVLVEDFKTQIKLQSYVRHAEATIVSKEPRLMEPIEVAIEQVRDKAIELYVEGAGFYRNKYLYDTCDQKYLSNFTMLLKGVADAGVNGGIGVYINTFFGDNDFAKEPINVAKNKELQEAIKDQIRVLLWGLDLHAEIADGDSAFALNEACKSSANETVKSLQEYFGDIEERNNPSFGELPSLEDLIPNDE